MAVAPAHPPVAADERVDSGDGDGGMARRRRRVGRRRWLLAGAVAAFGAALILSVSLFATNRLPGQTATGSISLDQSQQLEETLTQAATAQNEGKAGPGRSALPVGARRPARATRWPWPNWGGSSSRPGCRVTSSSVIDNGLAKLNRAVALDPGDFAVRLYLGTVQLQYDDNPAGAVTQYRQFLADGPPATLVRQAAAGDPRRLSASGPGPPRRRARLTGGVDRLVALTHAFYRWFDGPALGGPRSVMTH